MMKRIRFRSIFFSSWILAVIPALILFAFLQGPGLRYRFKIDHVERTPVRSIYDDINNDSISEKISLGKNNHLSTVSLFFGDNSIYDQWTFESLSAIDISTPFSGDYDRDKNREVFVFTYSNDSLFLNANEFLQVDGTKFDSRFITRIACEDGVPYSSVFPAGFFDRNSDGYDDLYFSITSGYASNQPRKVYCYDILNDSLIESEFSGVAIHNPEFNDADGDGKPEIFGLVSASGNYALDVPLSDSVAWFMVYDENLQFEFLPIAFPGFANSVEVHAVKSHDFRGYVASYQRKNHDSLLPGSSLLIYTTEGKEINRITLDPGDEIQRQYVFVNNAKDCPTICYFGRHIFMYDINLKLLRKAEYTFPAPDRVLMADVDNNGEDEFLAYSVVDMELNVFSPGLELIGYTSVDIPDNYNWRVSKVLFKNKPSRMYLANEEDGFLLTLVRNRYYYMAYLLYPGVYFAFVLFIFLIKTLTERQLRQQENLRNKLLTLQLQGIRSQLDPHFTFNALNSIASLVYLDDRKSAYDQLNKFTNLIRKLLNDAEKIYRTLDDEIDFVDNYLALEKLRFGDKWTYSINVNEPVSGTELVPKLVLQIFAENAVKHGLMDIESGGKLIVTISKDQDYLLLTIEDNGIGRSLSSRKVSLSGKGLRLINEFFELMNQVSKNRLRYLITDLYNESGSASGTRVEVWVKSVS